MPPTPFQPSHQTPFKSTLSSSQQSRVYHTPFGADGLSDDVSISIADIDPTEWTYHAEGGKNVLLSYKPAKGEAEKAGQSPFVTPTSTFALRIPKSLPSTSESNAVEEEEAEQFTRLIVEPLLGDPTVLPRCIKIPIVSARDRDIIDTLSARIEMQRPAARRASPARIRSETLSCIYAVEDVTAPVPVSSSSHQQVLCVEIKPKWGFLPHIDSLPPSSPNVEIKAKYSRYRMHRVAKQAASTDQLTREQFERLYDPLDLYSSDRARKETAVKALWNDWKETKGKTNNLRLFWNGAVVNPADRVVLTGVAQFLGADGDGEEQLVEALTRYVVDELSKPRLAANDDDQESVLSRLSHLQSTLDPLDVEGLAHLWLSRTQSHILGQADPHLDLPSALTACLPAAQLSTVLAAFLSVSSTRADVALEDAVQAFLVSATFKDCSLLLRFRRGEAGVEGNTKIVDLDSKPFGKLGSMQNTDNEVCAAFLGWLAQCGGSPPAASVAP
ncbi:hypothetical protein EX895_002586 [Sporisorium graminicola]|uniref:Inositol-pentakisphosphate 2-kinase n=1 Tax=Sporisorium graminicola TaxID=280036 RepID=A0A4U7KWP0_9BASI|nr:hypothetical protein EX895_002586 [Sporisorium graminicola]TKY88597.1 hypothetical protein EX895_002586 [Sporisorium graminicola]